LAVTWWVIGYGYEFRCNEVISGINKAVNSCFNFLFSQLVKVDEELFGDLIPKLDIIQSLIHESKFEEAKKTFEEYQILFDSQVQKYQTKKNNIKELQSLRAQLKEFKENYPDMESSDLEALLRDFQKEISILKTPDFSQFHKLVRKKKDEEIFDVLPQKIKSFEEKNILGSRIKVLKDIKAELKHKTKDKIRKDYEKVLETIHTLEDELCKYEELSEEFDEVQDKIHQLSDQLVDGKITSEAYSEAVKSFKERKEKLKEEIDQIAEGLFEKDKLDDIIAHMYSETFKKIKKKK